MTMTDDDLAAEQALSDLHHEAMLERAAREQAILVLVEGDSEEVAFPILFSEASDAGRLTGIKIANYNGNGSLVAFMRLLTKTLEHPYPIVLTYDNDPESVAAFKRCETQGLITDKVFPFAIPSSPVVQFHNGHEGGSFEEAFPPDVFLDNAFSESIMPEGLVARRSEFESSFERRRPWLDQVQKFSATHHCTEWNARKPLLAENMAQVVSPLPETFTQLVDLIARVRRKFPIIHPHDVELPQIRGLTC